MKTNLYVIYDTVADDAGIPFDAKSDGVAIRKFQAFVDSLIQKTKHFNPDEYRVYRVGAFDTETMWLTGESKPVKIDITSVDIELPEADEVQ